MGYLKEPLLEILLRYLGITPFAISVYYLFVCQDGLTGGAPVNKRLLLIRKALFKKLQEYPLSPLVIIGLA